MGHARAPLISVITATRNVEATIGRTITSVASQRFRDFEHIVVDGASTDRTGEIVRGAPYPVLLHSEPDQGIYDAFNKGIARARGELIAFLNGDDEYADDDVLADVAAEAQAHPEIDVFHGDMTLIDSAGNILRAVRFHRRFKTNSARNSENYESLAYEMAVAHPATFVRRGLIARIGSFDASFRIAGDYEFLLRAWRGGARFRHVDRVLVRMRSQGVSQAREWEADVETLRASRRHSSSKLAPFIRFVRHQAIKRVARCFPDALTALRAIVGRKLPAQHAATFHILSNLRGPEEAPREGGASRDRALVQHLASRGAARVHYLGRGRGYLRAVVNLLLALVGERGGVFLLQYPRLPVTMSGRFPRSLLRGAFMAALRLSSRKNRIYVDVSDLPVVQRRDLGLGADPRDVGGLSRFERLVFRGTMFRLIFASRTMAAEVVRRNSVSARRLQIAINGAPGPVTAASRTELEAAIGARLGDTEIVAVYAGTLNRERSVVAMLESIRRARRQVRLVLLGPAGEWLSAHAGPVIFHLGSLDEAAAMRLVAACDIGLLPYDPLRPYLDIAYPIKLSFYLAAGIPVLSTPIAEARREVEASEAGIIAPVDAWERVLDSADLSALRTRARAAAPRYYWKTILERLELETPAGVRF